MHCNTEVGYFYAEGQECGCHIWGKRIAKFKSEQKEP